MKIRYLLLVIYCLRGVFCSAQKATITPLRLNEVYTEVPNPLKAVAEKYPCQSLFLTSEEGKFKKLPDCEYEFYPAPEFQGKKAIIRLCRKQGKDTVVIDKMEFRVKSGPLPRATIAGRSEGTIDSRVLRAQLGIATNLDGFDFDCNCPVTSFQLALTTGDGHHTVFATTGPFFSKEMQQLLNTARPGDELVVFRIEARRNNRGLSLFPFKLIVQ